MWSTYLWKLIRCVKTIPLVAKQNLYTYKGSYTGVGMHTSENELFWPLHKQSTKNDRFCSIIRHGTVFILLTPWKHVTWLLYTAQCPWSTREHKRNYYSVLTQHFQLFHARLAQTHILQFCTYWRWWPLQAHIPTLNIMFYSYYRP